MEALQTNCQSHLHFAAQTPSVHLHVGRYKDATMGSRQFLKLKQFVVAEDDSTPPPPPPNCPHNTIFNLFQIGYISLGEVG